MEKEKLTQERLKEVLHYDPETGVFTWIQNMNSCVRKGDRAGWVSRQGYVRIRVNGHSYNASQLAFLYMTGHIPKMIDHINRVRGDNRWGNLREATTRLNILNKGRYKHNKSGITGIYFCKRSGRWRAKLKHKGVMYYFGGFDDKHDAIFSRYCAELQHGWHIENIHTDAKKYVDEYFGRLK